LLLNVEKDTYIMKLSLKDGDILVAALTSHADLVLFEEGIKAGPGKPGDSARGLNIPFSGRHQLVKILRLHLITMRLNRS
jgi:hypothetical protein